MPHDAFALPVTCLAIRPWQTGSALRPSIRGIPGLCMPSLQSRRRTWRLDPAASCRPDACGDDDFATPAALGNAVLAVWGRRRPPLQVPSTELLWGPASIIKYECSRTRRGLSDVRTGLPRVHRSSRGTRAFDRRLVEKEATRASPFAYRANVACVSCSLSGTYGCISPQARRRGPAASEEFPTCPTQRGSFLPAPACTV